MNLRHHGNRSEGYIAVPVDGIDKRVTASVVFVHFCTTAVFLLSFFELTSNIEFLTLIKKLRCFSPHFHVCKYVIILSHRNKEF